MKKKIVSILLATAMVASLLSGCGKEKETNNADNGNNTEKSDDADGDNTASGDVKEFTAFLAVPGNELNNDNVVKDLIAEKIGASCKETWLTGQTAEEAVGTLIAGGEYPDFICGSTGHAQLVDAGAYIAIDEYWDDYPNVKNFYSEAEWNKIREDDGHIYIIPQFGNVYEKDTATVHGDEAFWIQTRVLKWAEYPEINTLDEYFELINNYLEANPTMEDGTPNIGYEILSDDWRYFCLENPPFFLDGYPNDGCCIVDPETLEVIDYNTTDTAKRYFSKLSEEFKKGTIDPETFTMSYDQYIAKLSTGRVLGMVDQQWNFLQAETAIKQQALERKELEGCTYVPLGITIDKGIKDNYHSARTLDVSNGLGITVSCDDVEGAMKFLDDLLTQEILTLRLWGIEGVNYEVGEGGVFYRTQEQRDNSVSQEYKNANLCDYSFFPFYEGMNLDGINAYNPERQPEEFFESLTEEVQECLAAYGAKTYVEMLSPAEENPAWYPLWSYSNTFTADTAHGEAKVNMDEVKHEYLPMVIMAGDFETSWDEYMQVYESRVDVEAYISALQEEVHRRIAVAEGK